MDCIAPTFYFISFQPGFVSASRNFKCICIAIIHTFFSITGLNAISMSMQACAIPESVAGHFRSVFASEWRGGESVSLRLE